MTSAQVAVELDANRRFVRQGEVIKQQGTEYSVRWSDGSETTVHPGRHGTSHFTVVPRGGLAHRRFLNPDAVTDVLRSDPLATFLLALQESRQPVSSTRLIEAVTARGVDRAEVSAAWKRVKRQFTESDAVRSVGKPAKFTLRDGAVVAAPPMPGLGGGRSVGRSDSPADAALPAPTSGHVPGAEPIARESAPHDSVPAAAKEPSVARGDDELLQQLTELADRTAAQLPTESAERTAPAWFSYASALLRDAVTPQAITSAARTPLHTSSQLGRLPDRVLRGLTRGRPAKHLVPLIALRPVKGTWSAELCQTLEVGAIEALLDGALDELTATHAVAARPSLHKQFDMLVDRITRSGLGEHLALSRLLKVVRVIEPADNETTFERVLICVARSLKRTPDAWLRLGRERQDLARWTRSRPLTPGGGRVLLLQAIGDIAPGDVVDETWWDGVAFDDLASAAQGHFGTLLARPEVNKSIVRPLVARALADATTRRRLLTVLAMPATLIDAVPEAEATAAFLRISRVDVPLSTWIARLRDDAGRKQLEHELTDARRRIQSLQADEVRVRESGQRLAEQVKQLTDELAAAAAASTQRRRSEERQVQIDAMRSLALLATYVQGAISRQPSDRLIGRMHAMLARSGVTMVGDVGEETEYDPNRHEIVGPAPAAGYKVTIRQPACIWSREGEDVVLKRAVVDTA